MGEDLNSRVVAFVGEVCTAMGMTLEASAEQSDDNVWIHLKGESGELLLRRKGEGLDALQHIVNTAFRRELQGNNHFVVDCLGFRKNRDEELRQMAVFVLEKARTTGVPQEMGPLNPYARRIVHLKVAEFDDMSSESIGDAFLKTVIISRRQA
jgi:spoIIIJ-associated protein